MSKTMILELEDADYEALLREALASGQNVEELAAQRLRQNSSSPDDRSDSDLETTGIMTSSLTLARINENTYPIYPGFEALRPEVQAVAHALAARKGGTADEHARLWWTSLTPKKLSNQTTELESTDGEAERLFGTFNSGDPHSADNARIDDDLAKRYLAELDGNENAA